MNITLTKAQLKNGEYPKLKNCTLTTEQANVIAELLYELYMRGDNENE